MGRGTGRGKGVGGKRGGDGTAAVSKNGTRV